ncbi:xenobiotic-transporting ATPase [Sphingobacteriales bacterium UPWRP_1]|nr:hypothetical protein B6N25_12455 [Sphingobacteriales bacterium TSM_CSS]PSJ75297.1 xenobiotic-transporting ATPase [Sphingobacteriales bacterium UPWRP_1]
MAEDKKAISDNASLTPLKRFFRLLSVDRKDIGYLYIYSIFNGLINLSLPLGVQAIIGIIAGGQMITSWVVLIGIVTIGVILAGGLQIMQMVISETLQQRIFTRASFEFAYRIPRLKLEALNKQYVPELINRFFDTLSLQKGLTKILMDFSASVLQILFGLLLISFYHPLFLLFGVLVVGVVLIIFYVTGPQGVTTSLKESKYKYEVAHWLEEIARTMNTFKLHGNSSLPLNKTDVITNNYLAARKKHFSILLWQYIASIGFKTITIAGLLIVGSFLVMNNQINIGQFVAAEIVILLVVNSVEKLILSMETIYDVLTAVEKLGTVTDLPLEEADGLAFEQIDTGQGMSLQVRNLVYRFAPTEDPVINGLSFEVEAQDRLCISGYNSSGKSTLSQILASLFINFEGSITYNGIPAKNLNIASLRAHIGDYCSHEDIFRGTLKENITMGNPAIDIKQIIEATDVVGLTQFIQQLKEGFNTPIIPEGKTLPRSVVKKIILARSIISQPRLFVMEDPTAGLEATEQDRILQYLTHPTRRWTLIIVSNNPHVAALCNRIIVMKQGHIIDTGTFESILQKPYYNDIFNS